ncbi:MAG TPA: hypothetical protein VM142_14990, partial [Acidimicrobiales bacterium]|nr:hypothetical protein [Acidimicrobiales bacterium]
MTTSQHRLIAMASPDRNRSRRRAAPRAIAVLVAGLVVASITSLPGQASTTGGPRAWGSNNFGQLGLGNDAANSSRVTNPVPLPVPGLLASNLISIAGGTSHSLAVKADNTAWAWGSNSGGQLGDGTSGSNSSTPVQ